MPQELMPLVDIDRGSQLDKIHAKRMLHAFSQMALRLIALEDKIVDRILNSYSICVLPGTRVGIDYPPGAKQILVDELYRVKRVLKRKRKK